MTLLCLVLAGGPARAEARVTPSARAHFKAGVAYLRSTQPDHDANAYREFKAAYQDSPTWTILGNLGVAAHNLERDGEALDAFELYLARGGKKIDREEAVQVREDIAGIRSALATVTLEVARGPFWIVDTRQSNKTVAVVNEYGPFEGKAELRVRAGQHQFEVKGASTLPAWTVQLLPGDVSAHAFEPPPPAPVELPPPVVQSAPRPAPEAAESDRQTPTAAYVLWGVGAASLGVATGMYFQAAHVQSEADAEFRRACPSGAMDGTALCPNTTAGDAKAAHWRTATLLTGIAGASALIAGTGLYLLGGPGSESDSGESVDASNEPRPSLQAWVGVGSVGLSGKF